MFIIKHLLIGQLHYINSSSLCYLSIILSSKFSLVNLINYLKFYGTRINKSLLSTYTILCFTFQLVKYIGNLFWNGL